MKRLALAVLMLGLLPTLAGAAGWRAWRRPQPPPPQAQQIGWEIIDVEGSEFVCFTTRLGAIDCQPFSSGGPGGPPGTPTTTP